VSGHGLVSVLAALGEGQSGMILAFLIGSSWLLLRNDKAFPAGCAIGLAASIKLYPIMLFPYLLLKNRRAFAGALLVFVGLNTLLAAWNPANYRNSLKSLAIFPWIFLQRGPAWLSQVLSWR
jgi:uncharacterized membrane protein